MENKSKEVKLKFELPGFERKNIKIKLGKDKAEIKAEKKTESRVKRKDFFHEEKSYRSFSYYTTLPKINPGKAKIEFKKGVLRIVAPKE